MAGIPAGCEFDKLRLTVLLANERDAGDRMDAAAARSLEHDEEERFNAALLDAFTDDFKLEQMLWFRLGRKLAEIVPGESNRQKIVFKLIQDANAGGWWAQLLQAARDSQPQSLHLLTFAQEVGLAIAPPDEPAEDQATPTGKFASQTPWTGPLDLATWRTRFSEIERRGAASSSGGRMAYSCRPAPAFWWAPTSY